MKFGLIGAGMVTETHARCLDEIDGAELAFVYSRSAKRAEALAASRGAAVLDDLEEALAYEVEAVIITSPPYCHTPHAVAAMKAGRHVLVEKPMAVTPADCDAMIETARRHSRVLGVVHQSRFNRTIAAAKQFVQQGRLGELLHVSGYVKWHRPQSYYDANDWRGRVETEGGGVIFSQAGHTLDLMQWIGGPVDWVFTNMLIAPVHHDIDIENLGVVTMRFTNGAIGVLEASTALYPGSPERLEVHGTSGTIVVEAGALVRWDVRDNSAADQPPQDNDETGTGAADPTAYPITCHKRCIEDFSDAIRHQRRPLLHGGEARKLVDLCQCIYESARRFAPVHVSERVNASEITA